MQHHQGSSKLLTHFGIGFSIILIIFFITSSLITSHQFNQAYANSNQLSILNPKTSDGTPQLNDIFTGNGSSLIYTENSEETGNNSNVDLTTTLNNETESVMPLPTNSSVTQLNLTVSGLQALNQTSSLGNVSVLYSPIYSITYVNNSISLNPSWIDVQFSSNASEQIGNVNLTIYFSGIPYNSSSLNVETNGLDLNFTNQLLTPSLSAYSANLSMYFTNGISAGNESFPIYSNSLQPYSINSINQTSSQTVNPYIELQNNGIIYDELAVNFSVPIATNITGVNVFAKWALYTSLYNPFIVSIYQTLNSLLPITTTSLYELNQTTPGWFTFNFPLPGSLTAGQYYIVFSCSQLVPIIDNFDLYTTVTNGTTDQNVTYTANDGVKWSTRNTNLLFQIETQQYDPVPCKM